MPNRGHRDFNGVAGKTLVTNTIDEVWTEFWTWTQAHPAGAFLFRGQADASPIKPKIGRPAYNFSLAREQALFAAFERAARPFLQGQMTSFELLALAQHHGAPTRLADWSTTPLVAAFFAVSSYPDGTDARLYALDVHRPDLDTLDAKSGMTGSGTKVEDPLVLRKGVFLIETAQVSRRIGNQRGIFTLHGDPQSPLAVPPTQTFIVPTSLRNEFQSRLMDLGIDAAHIYPDINGLCASLDWRFRSGKAFSALA